MGLVDDEDNQLYIYEALQKASLSLISIFIPIYIVAAGRPVVWAFGYLLVQYGGRTVLTAPLSYVVARIGFKRSLLLSYAFYLPSILAIQLLGVGNAVIAAVGIGMACGSALHWVALHSAFALKTRQETRGRSSGLLVGAPRLGKAFAPVAGGLILATMGFSWLVAGSVAFLLLSAVPLLASPDYSQPMAWSRRPLNDRDHLRFAALFFFRGIGRAVEKFLFPLYVYLIIGTVDAGAVGSLLNIGGLLFALVVGRLAERFDRGRLIVVGAVATGALFVLKTVVTTPLQAFTVSLTAGMATMLYFIPLFSNLSDIADDEDVIEFFAFRESVMALGRVAVLAVGAYIVVGESSLSGLKATFLAASLGMGGIALLGPWIESERPAD